MAMGKLARVVVAVDATEESMNALRWALENLRLREGGGSEGEGGSESPEVFLVLHVQAPPSIAAGLNPGAIPFGGPAHVEVPAFAAAIEAHQKRITDAILNYAMQICAEKNAKVETKVVVGEPKEAICDITAGERADLLVMGCRAYGPIKRMFLGSVSNYCINNVQCPVVVIKGNQPC